MKIRFHVSGASRATFLNLVKSAQCEYTVNIVFFRLCSFTFLRTVYQVLYVDFFYFVFLFIHFYFYFFSLGGGGGGLTCFLHQYQICTYLIFFHFDIFPFIFNY